jgi:4-amino-4-deoxy-L-arabinose transferase-like glycosyltransferase
VCLFALRGGFLVWAVPPWQHPDEPTYLYPIRALTHDPVSGLAGPEHNPSERELIRSMAEFGWWTHYGRPTPDPLPANFYEGPYKINAGVGSFPGGPQLYYRTTARAFGWLGVTGLLPQLYMLRVWSLCCGALTVLLTFLAGVRWFGTQTGIASAAFLACLPQFVLVSTSASPDAAVNLCAAVSLWALGRDRERSPSWAGCGLALASALLAILIKRSGGLVLATTVATAFALLLQTRGASRLDRSRAWAMVGAVSAGLAILVLVPAFRAAADYALALLAPPVQFDRWDPVYVFRFFDGVARSWWLSGGWLTYGPPPWWYVLAALFTLALLLMLPIAVAQVGDAGRRAFALVLIGPALAVFGLMFTYFGRSVTAQGRYLFPALAATALLMGFVSCHAFRTTRARSLGAAALIGVAAMLAVSAVTTVTIGPYLG